MACVCVWGGGLLKNWGDLTVTGQLLVKSDAVSCAVSSKIAIATAGGGVCVCVCVCDLF